MSVQRSTLETELSTNLPAEIIKHLLDDYQHIKQQFFLKKFQPSELNAARFSESVLRLIEFLSTGAYTPFGTGLVSEKIINQVSNNITLPEGPRLFIPRITRILLDIRNKRNIAHVGGEVDPNYSDSLLVVHCADWILIEIIRNYHTTNIDTARKIVNSITETKIPVIYEVNGFIKVQNTDLSILHKTLLILYYKQPNSVSDVDLAKWLRYQNISRYKTQILQKLDKDALIHYEKGNCILLHKGIAYTEKNISFDLII